MQIHTLSAIENEVAEVHKELARLHERLKFLQVERDRFLGAPALLQTRNTVIGVPAARINIKGN